MGDPDHATGRPTVTVDVNGNWSNQRDLKLVHRIVLIKLSKISQKPERICCYLPFSEEKRRVDQAIAGLYLRITKFHMVKRIDNAFDHMTLCLVLHVPAEEVLN